MIAIIYKFVRPSARLVTHVSDFALVTAFSLAGVVLTFAIIHFGFVVSGIPG